MDKSVIETHFEITQRQAQQVDKIRAEVLAMSELGAETLGTLLTDEDIDALVDTVSTVHEFIFRQCVPEEAERLGVETTIDKYGRHGSALQLFSSYPEALKMACAVFFFTGVGYAVRNLSTPFPAPETQEEA